MSAARKKARPVRARMAWISFGSCQYPVRCACLPVDDYERFVAQMAEAIAQHWDERAASRAALASVGVKEPKT